MSALRVFISYSHDSDLHSARVRALADRLRTDGIESWIDQYVQDPNEGWIRWMRNEVKQADRVLIIFTETYQRRFEGEEEEGKGLGATFEGVIVTQAFYESGGRNAKFRPVVFDVADERFISAELRQFNHYRVDTPEGYKKLIRWLHEAPLIVAPTIGQKPELSPEPIFKLFPDEPDKSHDYANKSAQTLSNNIGTTAGPTSLAVLSLTDLRRLITQRMSRDEVGNVWYAVLETRMGNNMGDRPLTECVIELIERARSRNKFPLLIEEIGKERPDLADLAPPENPPPPVLTVSIGSSIEPFYARGTGDNYDSALLISIRNLGGKPLRINQAVYFGDPAAKVPIYVNARRSHKYPEGYEVKFGRQWKELSVLIQPGDEVDTYVPLADSLTSIAVASGMRGTLLLEYELDGKPGIYRRNV